MADIRTLTVDGTTYNIKDVSARADIANLKSAMSDTEIALSLGTGINGKFVNGSSGQLTDNKWYIASDLIDVSRYVGKTISIDSYFNGYIGIAFYASNGTTFVSGVTGTELSYTGQKKISQTVPSGAVYLRICEYTYTGLGLPDCSVVVPTKVETDILASKNAELYAAIEDVQEDVASLQFSPEKLGFKPTLTEKTGYFVGTNGYTTASNFTAFEPVAIPSIIKSVNVSCSFYGNSGVAFFNSTGEVVLSINGNNASTYGLANKAATQSYTVSVPEGAKTFGGSIYNNVYSSVADFNVSESTKTADILSIINKYNVLTDTLVSKWFPGKKIVTQGDSLTANGHTASDETNTGYWQSILHDILGATIINIGVGGTTVSNDGTSSTQNGYNLTDSWMCSDERVAMIPSDADMVLFWGGHNDWGKNVPIGTIGQSTPDDSTFTGGLQIALTKIITRVPNATIIFITPHVSRPATNANANVLAKNSLDLTMADYAKAVEEFCRYYGFPCISMADSGISILNHTKYCSDIIHVNNGDGAKAVASAIINGLVRYMPIVH